MAVSLHDVVVHLIVPVLLLLGLRKVVEQLANEGRLGVCVCGWDLMQYLNVNQLWGEGLLIKLYPY
jgi:hypothetical protein